MTIREIAEKTGVSGYTLRYYERVGLLPPVRRRESGIRDYTNTDAERIFFIQSLKASGMSLESILEYIELIKLGDITQQKRKSILVETRKTLLKKMEDLRRMLEKADKQLLQYDNRVLPEADKLAYIHGHASAG